MTEQDAHSPALASPDVEPYLAKLRGYLAERGVEAHSVSVPLGRNRLLLTPAEQRLVVEGLPADDDDGVPRLVRQGVGLRVATLRAIRLLERSDGAERGEATEELNAATDAALELERTMSARMRELLESKQAERANELGDVKKRLHEVVAKGLSTLEALESGQVPAPTPKQGSGYVYDWDEMTDGAEHQPKVRVVSKGRAGGPDPRRQRRLAIVAALLAIALGVSVAGLLLRGTGELPTPASEDFSAVPGVEMVVNRSPFLLVVVSPAAWGALDEVAKREAIEAVGEVAKRDGYRRAEIRTEKEPGLAVWTDDGTATVFR